MSREAQALLALAALTQLGDTPLSYPRVKAWLRDASAREPMDAAVTTIVTGSVLFWLAEKDVNPKVNTPWDAFVFVSTCMSVGYHDVFARTPAGKAIATAVMTFGPALTARVLNPPEVPAPDRTPELLRVQQVIADRLEAILGELRAAREQT